MGSGTLQTGSRQLRLTTHASPNFGPRRDGAKPDMVVLHYTAMTSAKAALSTLCNPVTEVSAHYLIAEDGEVMLLVPEEFRAWHAGAGRWGAVTDVNSHSIGIEIANTGFTPFAAVQMDALEELLNGIFKRWAIRPERVIGHSDMAPTRKIDPGPRFDWKRLARSGLSVWPNAAFASDDPGNETRFLKHAARFGYDPDLPFRVIFDAFCLRFRPASHEHTKATDDMIAYLAKRFPVDANARWV